MGATGVLLGGVLTTYWRQRGVKDAAFRTATGVGGMILPAAAAPIVANPDVSILLFGIAVFCLTFASGASAAALQEVTPNRLRAQTSAIYFFGINFIGIGLGPLYIAVITDYVLRDESQIGRSLARAERRLSRTCRRVPDDSCAPNVRTLAEPRLTG